MVDTTPWFPDYLAKWYDRFVNSLHHSDKVNQWRNNTPDLVGYREKELLADPHLAARDLNLWIERNPSEQDVRLYRALQASHHAILRAGIDVVREYGSNEWDNLRRYWQGHGNLLQKEPGVLLVRLNVHKYSWMPDQHLPSHHQAASHFPSFVRWTGSNGSPEIRVRVMAQMERHLRKDALSIAVIPLIQSKADFDISSKIAASGFSTFRMVLRDPEAAGKAAQRALDRAAVEGADIVIFPELCLTPEEQIKLKKSMQAASLRNGGRPWLLVAGSAHTPVSGDSLGEPQFYNQAIVLDGEGREVLSHHKLHPYQIQPYEEDRYGLRELSNSPWKEDIVVAPFTLEILETPIGRLAVLICEDLGVPNLFSPLVEGLAIDWLFVPVLDGIQTESRWTAQNGRRYADSGASVVVGTSLSLVAAHEEHEEKSGRVPGTGVGLIVYTKRRAQRLLLFNHESPPNHEYPVIRTLS